MFYFLKNFWYNIASVFWVVLILKTLSWCVRNTRLSVSSWRLCTGYPATCLSSYSVFQALIFFSMTVFKREIISQSVLTWLKTIIVFLRNIRNAVSILAVLQAGNFLYVQHGFKFSSWLMVNSLIWYFAYLRSTTKFASMLQDNVRLNVCNGR